MERAHKYTLIAVFLLIIFGVPIAQAIYEVTDDERPFFIELFTQAPSEKNLRDFETQLEEASIFEQGIRPRYQYLEYVTTRHMGIKALRGGDDWYFYTPGVKYLAEYYYSDPRGVPLTDGADPIEVIADFKAQLEAKGIELLVVPIPGKASVYPDKLSSAGGKRGPVYTHTKRFVEELTKRGVDVLFMHDHLIEARAAADKAGRALYMKGDTHWTGAGAKVAAKALAHSIRTRPWYVEATGKRYERVPIKVMRRGDVPKMTQIPKQEELFKEEEVEVFQIKDLQTGELYADDRSSPVLLLGDSFSRVFHTDEPKSAGVIANLAYELQQPIATIVNDGGASTLVRQQLARDLELLVGKRLVIWEFIERDIRFGMRGWQELQLFPEGWEPPQPEPAPESQPETEPAARPGADSAPTSAPAVEGAAAATQAVGDPS